MADLTVTNVRPWGGDPADLVMSAGTISDVVPAGRAPEGPETVDGSGLLALPGFVNAHAHVDKSWWGQPWVSYGGEPTTRGRIAHERAERDKYAIPSVNSTVAVLRQFLRFGTTVVRTHVDVDLGVGLRGIEVVREAVAALDHAIDVEIVAFPQDGVVRRPGVLDLLDDAAAAGVAHIGGLDPAIIDRDPVAQLDGLVEVARRHGVGIDIHLHDAGSLGLFEFELLADKVGAAGLSGRVNVAHGFALGNAPAGRLEGLLAALREVEASWTTVAPVGSSPLPWRRMRELGIPIGLGTDGVRDLWSPYGTGDMLAVAHTFARVHGLRHDEDLVLAVDLATRLAGPFAGRALHDLVPGARADVVLVDAENVQDALVRTPRRELVVAGGRIVARAGEVLV